MTGNLPRWRGGRPIFLTPLGVHSRYMLGAYLRHTLMVAAALMTIALTIDLWPQVALLGDDPRYGGPFLIWHIARLAVLRVPDLLPPLLPFATFLGVVWSESAFTESRERLLIWNSGRSPLLCLTPAVLAGVLMGGAVFVLDGLLRPAAIHRQMAEVLGREGIRLDRSQSGGNAAKNLIHRPYPVQFDEISVLFVIVRNWRCLLPVHLETLGRHLRGVIGATGLPLTTLDTLKENLIGNINLQHLKASGAHLRQEGSQALRLRDRSRDTIKEKAALAIRLREPSLNDLHDDIVRHQLTRIEDRLHLVPQWRA
jgi:hypothetical protein